MSFLNLIKTGKWSTIRKAKKSEKTTKQNIMPISSLMQELGVRTTSTIGSYKTEESPDKISIDQYIAMQDNDGTVRAITRLFSMPIQSTPIKVIAAKGDKGERQFIEDIFLGPTYNGGMSTPLPFVIADMTRAIFEGFRAYEKVPQVIKDGPHKGKIGWKKLAPRDADTLQIRSDEHGGFNGVYQQAHFQGRYVEVIIPAEKCILFTFQKERHSLYGESLLKTAFYHYDKKHKLYYLAHKKAEIDAVGLKILKISKPTSNSEVNAAEDVVDTLGINSRITLPAGFELEINRASAGYDVLPLIEHHDTQMVLSTLSQAITMGTGQKYAYTYGAGFGMQGAFVVQALASVMKNMEDTLNEWAIAQLIDWNFGTGCYPKIKLMPLGDETQAYLLSLFEALLKKDPERIPQEFIDRLTRDAAEKLGFDLEGETDAVKAANKAFENGKKTAADQNKVPAPATDNNTKKEIKATAEILKREPNFLEHYEALGRDYVISKCNGATMK